MYTRSHEKQDFFLNVTYVTSSFIGAEWNIWFILCVYALLHY